MCDANRSQVLLDLSWKKVINFFLYYHIRSAEVLWWSRNKLIPSFYHSYCLKQVLNITLQPDEARGATEPPCNHQGERSLLFRGAKRRGAHFSFINKAFVSAFVYFCNFGTPPGVFGPFWPPNHSMAVPIWRQSITKALAQASTLLIDWFTTY